jgi:4-hydroxymandelate oxidase
LQAVARNKLPIAHYGYLATGVDGEATLRANEEAFSEIHLRPAVR